uniref:Ulp1 protease family, C-terminal catalytic domain-containing protein n=1 Tax=Tanacetum cinerariifolium TaxID=118510 RepID=A0A6L2JFD9_TANCI|nr:ulp1 protease family, C-terminal catalytic domain-containing protein [Tanacetum cinerariifolium]
MHCNARQCSRINDIMHYDKYVRDDVDENKRKRLKVFIEEKDKEDKDNEDVPDIKKGKINKHFYKNSTEMQKHSFGVHIGIESIADHTEAKKKFFGKKYVLEPHPISIDEYNDSKSDSEYTQIIKKTKVKRNIIEEESVVSKRKNIRKTMSDVKKKNKKFDDVEDSEFDSSLLETQSDEYNTQSVDMQFDEINVMNIMMEEKYREKNSGGGSIYCYSRMLVFFPMITTKKSHQFYLICFNMKTAEIDIIDNLNNDIEDISVRYGELPIYLIKALLLGTDDKIKITLDENPEDIDLKMILEKRLAFFKELNHHDDDNAMVVLDNGNDVPKEYVKDNEVSKEKDDVTEKEKDIENMFEIGGKNTVQEINKEKNVENVVDQDVDKPEDVEKESEFGNNELELNHRDDDNAMVVLDNDNDVPEESVKDNEVSKKKDDVTEKEKDVENMFEIGGKNTIQEFNKGKNVKKVVDQDVDKPEDVEKEKIGSMSREEELEQFKSKTVHVTIRQIQDMKDYLSDNLSKIKALLLDTVDKIKIALDKNPEDIDLKMILEKRLAFFKELNHHDDDNVMVVLDNGNDVSKESVKDNEVSKEKYDVTEKEKDVENMFEIGGKNKVQNYPYKFKWADMEILISEGSPVTRTDSQMETYKTISQDIRDQLNAEAKVVQIILTGIDNDIYSTVDACPNALNVQFLLQLQLEWQRFATLVKRSQELKTISYHKLYDILKQHQHEVNEIRAERLAQVANPLALVVQQQPVYHPQNHHTHYTQNSLTRSQQVVTKNRGKAIVNSLQLIYDQEPSMVAEDDETTKDKEIDKLMALISLSFKKIYKPTNNNLQTSSNTSRANQDNSLRINKSAGYENQRIGNVAGARETVCSTMVQKSRIQCYNCKEFGHVARECHKLKRAKDVVYHREKMILNWERIICTWQNFKRFLQTLLILDPSLMMNHCKREEIDQNDDDNDLANECELLASLIEKLKCEIDENKNHNKILETSNKVLIEKLKGEIEDFKNKNKSLESSNNRFKEANNKLFETKNLLYTDFKKSEAKLARRNSMEYASKMEIECAQKEAQIKLYKTREDKELDKVIPLENKVKVLDNIVYKTGQSIQTMNMLNNKSPEPDKVIRLEKESRSKLCDLIRPFDYDKLNNLYDLFVPQHEKSPEQRYFLERSRLSHTSVNNGKSKESFNKQATLLEKPMDESIPLDKKCQSSIEIFKVKTYVNTIFNGVELCKEKSLTEHILFLNEIDRLSMEYYYADHMNAILGVYTELDEVTNLQCDYLELLEKCECLETKLSKSKMMSKSFEGLQKHAINLEIDLQQCQEKIKNDKSFTENLSKEFRKEREQYFEIQDLKAQLQDKGIVISELKKLIEKLKGKSVDTKFEKSTVIRQLNAFKISRPSILGKPTTF